MSPHLERLEQAFWKDFRGFASEISSCYFCPWSGVHVTLETLLGDEELKGTIKGLVKDSGRSHPVRDQVNDQGAGGLTVQSDADCKKQMQNGVGKIPLQSQ